MQRDPIPEYAKLSSSVIYSLSVLQPVSFEERMQDLVFKPKPTSKETFLHFSLANSGKKLYSRWSLSFYVHPLLRRNSLLRFGGLCCLNRVLTVLNNFLVANHVSPASTSVVHKQPNSSSKTRFSKSPLPKHTIVVKLPISSL